MARLLHILIFILPLHFLFGQSSPEDLKNKLKQAKNDTSRIILLSELSEICDVQEILLYAEPCLQLCEKALASGPEGKQKNFYLDHLSGAYNNLGFLAQSQGDISKAITYYEKSLKIKEEIKDKEGSAMLLNNIGSIYLSQGDIPAALDHIHKSFAIREGIGDTVGIAQNLNNLGYIYHTQGDIPKALEYYNQSLKIQQSIGDLKGVSYSLNNIGLIYDEKGNKAKALDYYQQSLAIQTKIRDKDGISQSLNNIGNIYSRLNNTEKALDYFKKSLEIAKETKMKERIAYVNNSIAAALVQSGRTSEALPYAIHSMSTAQELGFPQNIYRAATTLREIYKKQGKFKEALEMYTIEVQMRDSITNAETKKATVRKQFQYEYDKKAAADSTKNAEAQKVKNAQLLAQQAQLKQEKTQRFMLYGGLIIIIVFLAFVLNRFRVTQKQKAIIEDQKMLVDKAYEELHQKNKEVTDSIYYARRIQSSLLPTEKYIIKVLNKKK
jgi:tetratricopeptide (TPR) repeat protein